MLPSFHSRVWGQPLLKAMTFRKALHLCSDAIWIGCVYVCVWLGAAQLTAWYFGQGPIRHRCVVVAAPTGWHADLGNYRLAKPLWLVEDS